MNKRLKKSTRVIVILLMIGAITYIAPFAVLAGALIFLILGAIDVSRNCLTTEAPVLKRYFLGNGIVTWLLSPFNLLMDLFCDSPVGPAKGVFAFSDLPKECRNEVSDVLTTAMRERDHIIERVKPSLAESRRIMLMYKWYGQQIDRSISGFDKKFRYVKTIGVSIFDAGAATKYHYGPLRITYRLLYSLTPMGSGDGFIEVGQTKNVWRDNPMFIFDDTFMHRSVNHTIEPRYCLFVDIMRPSRFLFATEKIPALVGGPLNLARRLFYKNWEFVN